MVAFLTSRHSSEEEEFGCFHEFINAYEAVTQTHYVDLRNIIHMEMSHKEKNDKALTRGLSLNI